MLAFKTWLEERSLVEGRPYHAVSGMQDIHAERVLSKVWWENGLTPPHPLHARITLRQLAA
ncbi:MAG: hypothetical protein QXH12_04595 [Candidatus Caldarchaeum sp.]